MKIDKFYKNSFIVILANFFTGIFNFIFSIILSREISTEGLGLYGLLMPIYMLFACFTCDGLVVSVSKISAEYYSKCDYKNMNKTIDTALSFFFLWSAAIAVCVFVNSSNIIAYTIHDLRTISALKAVCPALMFMSFSAILKGYFYGIGSFKIPALIDILEKLIRIICLISLVTILSLKDIADTVTIAYIASAVGEGVSFIALFTFYKLYRNKLKKTELKPQSRIQLLFDVLIISFPLCLIGIFSASFSTISTSIIPHRLMSAGIPYHTALSLIGEFTRMALYITCFPIMIVNSISAVLIPDLSASLSRGEYWTVEGRIRQVFKIACLIAIPTLIICQTIPSALGELFYGRADLGQFIRFASYASFISFFAVPTFGILNGLGKQKILFRNSIIVSVLELIIIYIFTGIPSINIYGLGIELAVTSCITLILNYHEIQKVCSLPLSFFTVVKYPLIGSVLYIILKKINNALINFPVMFRAPIIIAAGYLIAFFLLYFLGRKLRRIKPARL